MDETFSQHDAPQDSSMETFAAGPALPHDLPKAPAGAVPEVSGADIAVETPGGSNSRLKVGTFIYDPTKYIEASISATNEIEYLVINYCANIQLRTKWAVQLWEVTLDSDFNKESEEASIEYIRSRIPGIARSQQIPHHYQSDNGEQRPAEPTWEKTLRPLEREFRQMEERIQRRNEKIRQKESHISQLTDDNRDLTEQLSLKNSELDDLRKKINDQDGNHMSQDYLPTADNSANSAADTPASKPEDIEIGGVPCRKIPAGEANAGYFREIEGKEVNEAGRPWRDGHGTKYMEERLYCEVKLDVPGGIKQPGKKMGGTRFDSYTDNGKAIYVMREDLNDTESAEERRFNQWTTRREM